MDKDNAESQLRAHSTPWVYVSGLEIGERYKDWHPHNCPVIERTADGVSVGACEFYLNDDHTTCPRHGKIRTRNAP